MTPADRRRYVVGVDVGGTFTDVVLGSSDGTLAVTKVTTTPDDPRDGVAEGVAEVLSAQGVDPADVVRVAHGTTLATNVILERRGSEVAFVTTAGFGDLLRLGREARQEDDRFDLFFQVPLPPVPHERTFCVDERVDARGNVVRALDPAALAEVAARVAATGPRAVAICLLHAYANPAHEQAVAAAMRAALPDAYVAASSEVWAEMREYDRAMTTVMCAYVGPVMAQYLAGLGARLAELGLRCPIEIMESSGGVLSAELAARRPITTVESGGAAGVMAAGFVGRLIGADEVISFDMGGTTAKAGIVRHGRPDVTHDFRVGGSGSAGGVRQRSGYPVKIPVVDMAEVGSGGGSIAWVDSGGSLRVGPRSSGSVPGPASYGRGGTEPTVTDANLLLGYLRPGHLSGAVSLDVGLAEKAVERAVAGPLGLDLLAAARAIHDVANVGMAAAIRVVTVQRGIDPRGFTLVGFGGAGPLHAVELAESFGIDRVVVPRAAGVASAVGLVTSDLVVEEARTAIMATATATADPAVVARLFAELEAAAISALPAGDDAASPPGGSALTVSRAVEARYRGQAHQLEVAAPGGPVTADTVAQIDRAFADRYGDVYGIELDAPTELVNFRVRVSRALEKLVPVAAEALSPSGHPAGDPVGERPVAFAGLAPLPCPVYRWEALGPGARLAGPVVVEGDDTTVVVPPGRTVEGDRWGNLVITRVT